MSRPHKTLVLYVALLALLGAQVFGLQRGYSCDYGGIEHQTDFDHCHGPHSLECHDGEAPHEHHAEHHGEDESGKDTHHHAPYVESLESFKPQTKAFVPISIAAVLALPSTFLISPLAQTEPVSLRLTPQNDRSPPECLRVVRTQVILV